MRNIVMRGLQVLRRTAAFLGKEITVETTMGPISRHVIELNGVIDRLSSLAAEQGETGRMVRDLTRKAREQADALVRAYARPVARQSKLLFAVNTDLRESLKVPSRRVGYEKLIAHITGFANRAEEHKAKFVEAGLAEDFVERLRGQIKALEKTLAEKAELSGRRSAATAGAALEFSRAREMVRMLDSMVAPILVGTGRLASWKSLSRFVREPQRDETEVPVEGAVTSSSTSVPAVAAVKPENPSPNTHVA
jgi:hypothetical protein